MPSFQNLTDRIIADTERAGVRVEGRPAPPEPAPAPAPAPRSTETDYSGLSVEEMKAESARLAQESPQLQALRTQRAKAQLFAGLEEAIANQWEEGFDVEFEVLDEDGDERYLSTSTQVAAHLAALSRLNLSDEEKASVRDLVDEDEIDAAYLWYERQRIEQAGALEEKEIERAQAEDVPAFRAAIQDLVKKDRFRRLDPEDVERATITYMRDMQREGLSVDTSPEGLANLALDLGSRFLFADWAQQQAELETEQIREAVKANRFLSDRSEDEFGNVVYRDGRNEDGEMVRVPILDPVAPDFSEQNFKVWKAETGNLESDLKHMQHDERQAWADELDARVVAREEADAEAILEEGRIRAQRQRDAKIQAIREGRGIDQREPIVIGAGADAPDSDSRPGGDGKVYSAEDYASRVQALAEKAEAGLLDEGE